MKCENCGFENLEDFTFCANCGQKKQSVMMAQNNAGARALAILNSKLYLALCILLTVASGLYLIMNGPQVIFILLTIFAWIAFANGKKGIVDYNDFRRISGTVYANYVITNVAAIILIVCSIIMCLLTGVFSNLEVPNDIFSITSNLESNLEYFPNLSLGLLPIIFGVIFAVAGIILLVFNLLGMRKIHRFAKEFYIGITTGETTMKFAKAAKDWLIFFAVVDGVSAISNLSKNILSGLSQSAMVAAIIITIIIINKYILTAPKPEIE